MPTTVTGQLIDPVRSTTFGAAVIISDRGTIDSIRPCTAPDPVFILPGLVDAHVHIESSMLTPTAFAQAAVRHGTIAAVADPHEIANVLGLAGVERMLASARQTPFIFGFGVPSCVPATPFETAGATLGEAEVIDLLRLDGVTHLAEMMNVPGILQGDPGVMAKIRAAQRAGKPIDGHAPGLVGPSLKTYVAAGISTDHECLTLAEAVAKIELEMSVQIRHGSAASDFEPFLPLLERYPEHCMFCSDDKHPDDLLKSHINAIAATAYRSGVSIYAILRAASVNPVRHYRLPMGLLQSGDRADFVLVENLNTFTPRSVYLRGACVFENGRTFLPPGRFPAPPPLAMEPLTTPALAVPGRTDDRIQVIRAIDGSLATGRIVESARVSGGTIIGHTDTDTLKLVVCNRHRPAPPAVAFIHGFGLQGGAIASSVAHDCHNIIAVGVSDTAIAAAVNEVITQGGGLAVANNDTTIRASLPLPIAGLMSTEDAETVAARYAACDHEAKALGSPLHAPFMTLSFMALPVIPELKLTDKGLFDVTAFRYTALHL